MKSEQELIERARKAAEKAYVPYRNFPVGAVVETESGDLFDGCNVANASTLAMCAERTAIFNAIVHGHKDIKRIAVSCIKGDKNIPETLMPCGACRQVMAEFMPSDAEVIVDGVGTFKLKDLLPLAFSLNKQG